MKRLIVFILFISIAFAQSGIIVDRSVSPTLLTFPGDVTIEGTLHASLSEELAHGKLVGVNEAGDDITITTAETYYKYTFTDSTAGVHGAHNLTYDDDNDRLTVDVGFAGHYLVILTASLSSEDAERTVHIGIGINGTVGSFAKSSFKVKFADRINVLTTLNTPDLNEGDYIEAYFTSSTNADVLSIYHLNMAVLLLDKD